MYILSLMHNWKLIDSATEKFFLLSHLSNERSITSVAFFSLSLLLGNFLEFYATVSCHLLSRNDLLLSFLSNYQDFLSKKLHYHKSHQLVINSSSLNHSVSKPIKNYHHIISRKKREKRKNICRYTYKFLYPLEDVTF